MNHCRRKRIHSCVSLGLVITLLIPTSVRADVPLKDKFEQNTDVDFSYNQNADTSYYSNILREHEEYGYRLYKDEPQTASLDTAAFPEGITPVFTDIDGKTSFHWQSTTDYVEWTFEVSASALYCFELDYYLPENTKAAPVRSLSVDGELPFFEANSLSFPCAFRDKTEPSVNTLGDDIWPAQELLTGWRTCRLEDSNAHYDNCFEFYLKQGTHTIRLSFVKGDMYIHDFRLVAPKRTVSYAEVQQIYRGKGYSEAAVSDTLLFQAESSVAEKSDTAIRREYDSDPLSVPYSVANRRLNVLGGARWASGGQKLTLSFEVPEDGLYKIGFRLYHAYNDGLPSYRRIEVDGQLPFSELSAYAFHYSPKWQTVTLASEENEPYLFYLEKGPHTVSMTVTVAPYRELVHSLNNDTLIISSLLQDITEIIGNDPDYNYDYKLDRTIPTLNETLTALIDSMQEKYDAIGGMTARLPAMANNFLTIRDQLQQMLDNPYTIPRKVDDLNTALTSLGTWYKEIQKQALMLDNLMVAAPSNVWQHKNSSFFAKVWGAIVNFVLSFVKNYNAVGGVADSSVEIKDTITVWVSYGSEWAEQIKELSDTTFTTQQGIAVDMNILPAGQLNTGSVNALLLSITSGQAPDVALGVAYNSPVEFAMRDATLDLSAFPDFPEIKTRFLDNIFTPFVYNNGKKTGIYALPETMSFEVMFYRKDILSQLKIPLPNTRQDLYDTVLPMLYQNNMQFFFPVDFTMFLYQYGADYYTADGRKTALDTPQAYQAIKECTELYTNYGVPVTADFYNRFRTGEMPIGISNFNLYVLFSTAAPELAGRWGIAPIPGTPKADGTIDRSAGGLIGQAAIIMNSSQKKESSWEFLKWWTSTETQTTFSQNMESLIGAEARWASANIEAFSALAWNKGELDVLRDYWKWAKECPVVLGGYYTTRHLNNAWNRIINDDQPVRDALEAAVYDINRELRAKQEEYGIYE